MGQSTAVLVKALFKLFVSVKMNLDITVRGAKCYVNYGRILHKECLLH